MCSRPAFAYGPHSMHPRPLLFVLTVVLLLGRVGCAWGWMADPCCKEVRGHATQVAALHGATTEVPAESPADHALHAGHCHCVFQVETEVAVTHPVWAIGEWAAHAPASPDVDPGSIDWPPEARS